MPQDTQSTAERRATMRGSAKPNHRDRGYAPRGLRRVLLDDPLRLLFQFLGVGGA